MELKKDLLRTLLAAQEVEGYLSERAMAAAAEQFSMTPGQVYETASFYSMIRLAPAGKTIIQICRNAPCHVAGAAQTISALETALGIRMGETTADGACTLEYVECLGQCQASPCVLVGGKLYTGVTADKVPALISALNS